MSSEDPTIDKEEKKAELLQNKELSKEEIQKLRKDKKEAAKRAKKEMATKKAEEIKKQETLPKPTKEKGPKGPGSGPGKGKPQSNVKRAISTSRDRTESIHELPTGLDNVSVTVEEIMDKYYGKLHHEVVSLGLKLVAERITDASLRCLAIIRAIIKFTKDYQLGK